MSKIRDCEPEDAEAIALIYNQSIGARDSTMDQTPKSKEEILKWINAFTEQETILVFEDEDRVLGWGIIKRYSDREGYRFACETSVYIRRDLVGRRLGVGTQIQQALIERCRAFGYHHLVAKIWADNQISLDLHKKFGYETAGIQREIGCTEGRWQDVAILQLVLE